MFVLHSILLYYVILDYIEILSQLSIHGLVFCQELIPEALMCALVIPNELSTTMFD